MSNPDGGPAFPHDSIHQNAGGFAECWEGMTLRDYFAARAMPKLMERYEKEQGAALAYAWADAMIKERYR